MFALKLLLSVFFWVIFQVGFFLIVILSLPAALLGGLGSSLIYYLIKLPLRLLFLVCFIRGKVFGIGNIPKDGKVILVSNMPTLFDPLFYIAYFPRRLRFVAEGGMFKVPFLGWLMKVIGCIPIPTKKDEYFIFARAVIASLPVVVFRGSAGLAGISGIKTIPASISGTEHVISAGLISPGEVKIAIS